MKTPILQVDAFTKEAFRGNPAAVCILQQPADERWMQHVALEMNLSETAFLWPEADHFRLRWFTPTVEVDLCGHATLASAHALWESATVPPFEPIRFQTRSGELRAERGGDLIYLDLPAQKLTPVVETKGLEAALGMSLKTVVKGSHFFLAEVAGEAQVREYKLDLSKISALGVDVILTAKGETGEFDFVSRVFCPTFGIPEDPVTGAAHCALGPYWKERLKRSEFVAYQASARGGVVRVQVAGDRVRLGGHAVSTLRGELLA